MGGFSIWHLLVVLVVAMLLFGSSRVSEMGKGLGEGIRNFKKGLREDDDEPPPARRPASSSRTRKKRRPPPPSSSPPAPWRRRRRSSRSRSTTTRTRKRSRAESPRRSARPPTAEDGEGSNRSGAAPSRTDSTEAAAQAGSAIASGALPAPVRLPLAQNRAASPTPAPPGPMSSTVWTRFDRHIPLRQPGPREHDQHARTRDRKPCRGLRPQPPGTRRRPLGVCRPERDRSRRHTGERSGSSRRVAARRRAEREIVGARGMGEEDQRQLRRRLRTPRDGARRRRDDQRCDDRPGKRRDTSG